MHRSRPIVYLTLLLTFGLALACNLPGGGWDGAEDQTPAPTHRPAPTVAAPETTPPPPPVATAGDKWALWSGPTQLRGANTWQRVVVPELD